MGELIKRFWESLILPLMNERGEVDPDPEPEPDPGDPKPEPEPGEPEPEPEPAEPAEPDPALIDPEPEPEPDPVPYARFKEVHTKSKDLETKLDQFKRLGHEGYYKLYPDERPTGEPEPDPDPEPVLSASEMADHRISGGDHDGKTLGEVMELDVLAGLDIYNAYKADMEGKKVSDARLREESEREVQTFISVRAQEAFGKPVEDLTKEEVAQVEELSTAVSQWMEETGRGGTIIEDGYFLMNKEKIFDDAKTETLKGIVEALKTPGTASISPSKTEPTETGYTRFLNMTPDQVKTECDKFTEAENDEFLRKAPAAVRKKFPSLPWDA